MFGWDTLVLLKHLLDEGLTKTDIAKRLGVSRRVVHHWIQTGQLERDLERPDTAADQQVRNVYTAVNRIVPEEQRLKP